MRSFEISFPSTVSEAVTFLGREGARPIAGGTDLLCHMRAGLLAPACLVDLSGLSLSYVRQHDGLVQIGAMTPCTDVVGSPLVRKQLPDLAEAAAQIGGVQTRNMATLGGNLCSAVPSADSAPPLLVHEAHVRIAGPQGERLLPLDQLFVGPRKTALQAGEIVVEIQVPVPQPRTGAAFFKLGRRRALTLAIVNAAARLSLGSDGETVESICIAVGAVAPIPLRARQAESLLFENAISATLIEQAAAAAAAETAPISDMRATARYRRQVTQVLVQRALERAWQRARGEADGDAFQPAVSWSEPAASRTAEWRPGVVGSLREAVPVDLRVNGQTERVVVEPRTLLSDVLRDQLGWTGTKVGCGTGECGACTVLLDGRPVNSCLTLAVRAQGQQITTIEGLATAEGLHPLQQAFIDHGALQCGFCGPGMLLSAKALLDTNPAPTRQEIRSAIAGNICRCTGYVKIVAAIEAAARAGRPGEGQR